MSFEYSIDSAKTANFPPFFVLGSSGTDFALSGASDDLSPVELHATDPTTAICVRHSPTAVDIMSVVSHVNQYAINPGVQIARGPATARAFRASSRLKFVEMRLADPSLDISTSPTTFASSATVELSSPDATWRGVRIAHALAIDAIFVRIATIKLKNAKKAAVDGDLRLAYREAYVGLDELFRRGKWEEVATELSALCKGDYPAAFSIGVMRFSSTAAMHIPGWSALLKALAQTAKRQGMDIRRAMRGLLETNAIS